jgi:translocation and assembly module TamA
VPASLLQRAAVCCALVLAACTPPPGPQLPGATDIRVSTVAIVAQDAPLVVDYAPLLPKLAIRTARSFNAYRIDEDRVRITSFLMNQGYFDATVETPTLAYTNDRRTVGLTWRVHEGARYTVASIEIVGAPPALEPELRALLPFAAGDQIDVASYRMARKLLANRLREAGYGRAQGYSRTFAHREAKTVAWYYFFETGPQTRVGALEVSGNKRVPASEILALAGLQPGQPYSPAEKRRAELALLDSGTFASATVYSEADDIGPPQVPDKGGSMTPDQIDARGQFTPRTLDPDLAVRVSVVEAPSRQLRAELGVDADPSRVDVFAGARVWLRDLFGPLHHVALEGNVGHGWFVDERDPVQGVYGSALAQYQRPGWLGTRLELRLSGRWRDTLLPSALLRELTVGPGLRATLAAGVYVEGELHYRYGRALGMPMLDAMTSAEVALPTDDVNRGAELVATVVADRRNDRIEATDGWFASLRTAYAPGGALGGRRWLQLVGDARTFIPVSKAWSVALRANGGIVPLDDGEGIPLGPRLFGGGVSGSVSGMRGFARDHMAPRACGMATTECDVLVGGRSLAQASVELRWLPVNAFYGATLFADAGAVGAGLDPFVDGISAAVGAGIRLRTWYLPVSIDLAYRVVENNAAGLAWNRVLGFLHIGEAF